MNQYREKTGADPVVWDSKLAAFANFRGYVNVTEYYYCHDWLYAPDNSDLYTKAFRSMNAAVFGENAAQNVTKKFNAQQNWTSQNYTVSSEHYDAI